jgi:hypothetical protein
MKVHYSESYKNNLTECGKDNFSIQCTNFITEITCKSCIKTLRNNTKNKIYVLENIIEQLNILEAKLNDSDV